MLRDRFRRKTISGLSRTGSFSLSQDRRCQVGLGRRDKREAERVALEREAAEIIEVRIADGRPPPEVFKAAALRRAAKGLPSDAWYRPDDAPEPVRPTPAPRRLAPVAGADLVLRVVKLPLPAAPVPAATARREVAAPQVVVEASN